MIVKTYPSATNLAWALRIDRVRMVAINDLLKQELKRQIADEGTSEAQLLHFANHNLNTVEELIYAASKIENLIYYGY